ncbi:hypothetical protein CDD80_187 [Ophiocordyceps camponoti-rufipedis]|uniref:Sfi1 spindle body domain-containing protein n=1 Tax=Ophiocordyceps camponoti-rufipedis TaxID=2004952 RepID=A0A2C5ZCR9_9HYPO|nr:hypothetical protein CDD80_187 [Ophiocordyceps camponoti-rufipedis]
MAPITRTKVIQRPLSRLPNLYGVDPDLDHHLSALVFRIGGEQGHGTLLSKFQAILGRMGIVLEFGDDTPSPEASPVFFPSPTSSFRSRLNFDIERIISEGNSNNGSDVTTAALSSIDHALQPRGEIPPEENTEIADAHMSTAIALKNVRGDARGNPSRHFSGDEESKDAAKTSSLNGRRSALAAAFDLWRSRASANRRQIEGLHKPSNQDQWARKGESLPRLHQSTARTASKTPLYGTAQDLIDTNERELQRLHAEESYAPSLVSEPNHEAAEIPDQLERDDGFDALSDDIITPSQEHLVQLRAQDFLLSTDFGLRQRFKNSNAPSRVTAQSSANPRLPQPKHAMLACADWQNGMAMQKWRARADKSKLSQKVAHHIRALCLSSNCLDTWSDYVEVKRRSSTYRQRLYLDKAAFAFYVWNLSARAQAARWRREFLLVESAFNAWSSGAARDDDARGAAHKHHVLDSKTRVCRRLKRLQSERANLTRLHSRAQLYLYGTRLLKILESTVRLRKDRTKSQIRRHLMIRYTQISSSRKKRNFLAALDRWKLSSKCDSRMAQMAQEVGSVDEAGRYSSALADWYSLAFDDLTLQCRAESRYRASGGGCRLRNKEPRLTRIRRLSG